MKINTYFPPYYAEFRCLAAACPASCCKDWEVEVDEASAARYRAEPGKLGDTLRAALRREDGSIWMTLKKGECPLLCPDGLCRIQSELGEQALCKTCREFPRLTHDYGSFLEYGLELSCPEAARRILCSPATLPPVHPLTGEEEYDSAAMTLLLRTRQQAIALLAGDAPPKVSAGSLLEYGARVQRMLDGSEEAPVPDAQDAYFAEITEFFANLEPLTDRWQPLLCQARLSPLPVEALPLLRYFVGRYWLQAIADDDLLSRIKLFVVAAVLISALPGDFTANAVLFSREIENSAENMDLLLDLLAYSPRFSCRAVARLLL